MRKILLLLSLSILLLILTARPVSAEPLPERIPFDRVLTVERDENVVEKNLEKNRGEASASEEEPAWPKTAELTKAYYRKRIGIPFLAAVGVGCAVMFAAGRKKEND